MYEKLVNRAEQYNVPIAGCPSITEYENGFSANYHSDREEGIISGKECILDFLYSTKHAWGACHNKIYKRDVFDGISFPNVNHFEDYVVSLQLFYKTKRLFFCNSPMYYYNSRAGSVSKRGFYEGKLKILETSAWMKEYLIEMGADKDLMGGACYFHFCQYCNLLWEVHNSDISSKKRIISDRKSECLEALRDYIKISKKKKSDIKLISKMVLAFMLP